MGLYDNNYNRTIASKVRQIDRNHVDRINQISESNTHDITSPLEGMTMRNDAIQGGSGFASASLGDMGFEPTNGATHTNASGSGISGGARKPRTARPKKGAGISGGALLTDLSANTILRPQPAPGMEVRIAPTASPHKDQPIPQPAQGPMLNGPLAGGGVSGGGISAGGISAGGVSGGKRPSARNVLVRQIMKEKGMSLPQASRHIKENNLYKK